MGFVCLARTQVRYRCGQNLRSFAKPPHPCLQRSMIGSARIASNPGSGGDLSQVSELGSARKWISLGIALVVVVVAVVLVVVLRAGGSTTSSPSNTSAPGQTSTSAGSVPQRTAPVPPPTPGSANQTVKPVRPGPTTSARINQPVDPDDDVRVSLVKVASGKVKATGPGDTNGPAVIVKVRIENRTDQPIDLGSATVSLLYGKGRAVGTPSPSDPARPFDGVVNAGDSAEATYVFRVPRKTQDKVTILVTYAAGAAVAKFDGAVR